MNGWTSVPACPLCGHEKSELHSERASNPRFVMHFEKYDLPVMTQVIYRQCGDCGLIYQDPRMDDAALGDFYASGMYRKTTGLTDTESDRGEQERAAALVDFLDGMAFESVLDIGCSRGYFLSTLDCYCRGVETDRNRPFMVDESKILAEIPYDKQWELVTLVHYLEHVANPLDLLLPLDCRYLYIEVPSERSLGGPFRFPHLTVWTPETLFRLVSELGANVIKYRRNPHHCLLLEMR
jgi:hypothetical protein